MNDKQNFIVGMSLLGLMFGGFLTLLAGVVLDNTVLLYIGVIAVVAFIGILIVGCAIGEDGDAGAYFSP